MLDKKVSKENLIFITVVTFLLSILIIVFVFFVGIYRVQMAEITRTQIVSRK